MLAVLSFSESCEICLMPGGWCSFSLLGMKENSVSSLASLHLHLRVLVVLFYKTSQSGPGLGLWIVSYLCKDPFQIRSQSQQWGESIHQHFRRHSSAHKSVKVIVLCFNLLDKYRTIKAFCAKEEVT